MFIFNYLCNNYTPLKAVLKQVLGSVCLSLVPQHFVLAIPIKAGYNERVLRISWGGGASTKQPGCFC